MDDRAHGQITIHTVNAAEVQVAFRGRLLGVGRFRIIENYGWALLDLHEINLLIVVYALL